MYTYRILLYLLGATSTFFTLGSCRECYRHGYSFKDIKGRNVDEAIGDFCERYVPKNFVRNQKTTVCYSFPPDNSGSRVEMEIWNMEFGSQGMSSEECKEKLISLHNQCERGGKKYMGDFWYRLDPNYGGC